MPRPGRGAEMEGREERSLHYGRDDKRLRVKARRGAMGEANPECSNLNSFSAGLIAR